jgi:hypothetical protein
MNHTCEKCNYSTNNVTNYKKHLATKKHLFGNKDSKQHTCKTCELMFSNRMSLWRHKNKCVKLLDGNINMNITDNGVLQEVNSKIDSMNKTAADNQVVLMEIVKTLITIVEQLKQPQLQSNSNVLHENATMNNNSHNTVLMMLNTNHSHVISMDAFIKNMEVSLERTLSALDKDIAELNKDIFMDNLAGVSPDDRPIHCSDAKRDTYYVKGPTEWYKDHGEKLVKAIQEIFNLNIRKLMEWQKEHLLEIQNNDRIGTEFMQVFKNISGPEDKDSIDQIKNKTIALINQLIPISDVK